MELIQSGLLFVAAMSSLQRVITGFSLAVAMGVPLGLLLGVSRRARTLSYPFIEILRTVSPLAWLPFAVLWFGIGDGAAVFIIVLAAIFPIVLGTAQGIRGIPPEQVEFGRTLGLSGGQLVWHVLLPAARPSILTALRIGLGIAWLVIVAAEMVGLQSGLGALVVEGRNLLDTSTILVAMATIAGLGLVLDGVIAGVMWRWQK